MTNEVTVIPPREDTDRTKGQRSYRLRWIQVLGIGASLCTLKTLYSEQRGLLQTLRNLQVDSLGIGSNRSHNGTNIPPPLNVDFEEYSTTSLYAFDDHDIKVFEKHRCVVLQDVCRSGQDWFNKPSTSDESHNRQPSIVWKSGFHGGVIPAEVRIFNGNNTRHPYQHTNDTSSKQFCPTSHVANHIVLCSVWLDMLSEFYLRLLIGLWRIFSEVKAPWWKETQSSKTKHVQFYIHKKGIDNPTLISSIHPLMDSFSGNRVVNIEAMFQQTGCECMDRLIFCGYEHNIEPTSLEVEQPTVLEPAGVVGPYYGELDKKSDWNDLHRHIRFQSIGNQPDMQEKIWEFKADTVANALIQANHDQQHRIHKYKKVSLKRELQNLDAWTMVGFAQRSDHRRWLNLGDIMQHCLAKWVFPHRVVCVEINLDTPFGRTPFNQVLLYGGLDALVGIHGSQQVHATWMPPGSFQVELLPHLVSHFGTWTQTTEVATCNGKITDESELNHLGYPLTNASIPDCEGFYQNVPNCNNQMGWFNRDFVVPVEAVESFVKKFLVLPEQKTNRSSTGSMRAHPTVTASTWRPCEDYEKFANDEFVIYNVNCWNGTAHEVRHYYRPRSSFAHLKESEA